MTSENPTPSRLKKGIVQIYTGDGKGKTTAAFGLALRASGQGLRVAILQFMKEGGPYETGESKAVGNLPGVELHRFGRSFIYSPRPSKEEVDSAVSLGISLAKELLSAHKVDLLILDEILIALWYEVVTLEDLYQLIDLRPDDVEMVLTGRRAPQELIDRADLVTEMTLVKHPYDTGLGARQGIEY